jgi:hypothetical protein
MIHKHIQGKTVTSTLVGAGVGGAAYFAAMKAGQSLSFLQGRWWATPAALLIAGHLVKRWSEPTGQATVGAAGALLAMSYYVQSGSQLNAAHGAGDAGRLGPGYQRMPGYITAGARGVGDAGALRGPGAVLNRSEAGMLRDG